MFAINLGLAERLYRISRNILLLLDAVTERKLLRNARNDTWRCPTAQMSAKLYPDDSLVGL